MKEKLYCVFNKSSINIEESQIVSFQKIEKEESSFRVYKDEIVGIHYQQGKISDEEGYKRAEENLKLNRPYPFELEVGVRHRDKLEKTYTDKETLAMAKNALCI